MEHDNQNPDLTPSIGPAAARERDLLSRRQAIRAASRERVLARVAGREPAPIRTTTSRKLNGENDFVVRDEHDQRLFAFAANLAGRDQAAELMQELVLRRISGRFDRYDLAERPLIEFRALRNLSYDRQRRLKARPEYLPNDTERSQADQLDSMAGGVPGHEYEEMLDRLTVDALLVRLEARTRRVCRDVRDGRGTRAEIAERYGMNRSEAQDLVAGLADAPEIAGPRADTAAERRAAAAERVAENRRRKREEKRAAAQAAADSDEWGPGA